MNSALALLSITIRGILEHFHRRHCNIRTVIVIEVAVSVFYTAVCFEITTLLRQITCHMGSHGVTCRRDARLSRPGWWLHVKIVYLQNIVSYLRNNRAVSWLEIKPTIKSYKSNIITITPPGHHATIYMYV